MSAKYSQWISAILFALVLAGALLGTTTAFADSSQQQGDNRYSVSDVHYTLNTAQPEIVDAVSFTLQSTEASRPSAVRVKLGANDAAWHHCRPTGSTWSCEIAGGFPLASLSRLEVDAR